jgi:hypothetical protein
MPTSKHRRKAGGKTVKHPGRGKPPREWSPSPAMLAWRTFSNVYCRPFHQQWPGHPAGELLDIVSAGLFDADTRTFHTANKVEMFIKFLEPFEEQDETLVSRTPEQAEAALAFLVEQNMVVVEDELIAIHPRFADVLNPPLAQVDANAGEVSAVSPVFGCLWGLPNDPHALPQRLGEQSCFDRPPPLG